MSIFAKKRIADLPTISREEARRSTRIVVIDDDPHSFPLALLKREGYAIDQWEKVTDLGRLEAGAFDIIILDIQGVAMEYSASDGLGILEHLKAHNPAQIVIAFSGMTFDLSKNRFWRLADDSLAKPIDAATAKRVIDDMIEKKRTPGHYWSVAADALRAQGISEQLLPKIEHAVAKALLLKDESGIRKAIATLGDLPLESAAKVAGIVFKIISLLKG